MDVRNLKNEIWKDGKVNPFAFSDVAKRCAKKIAKDGREEKGKNAQSQIRKYYDSILRLYEKVKQGYDFDVILMELNRELALIYYAKGRNKVTDSFVIMMESLIKEVDAVEKLEVITMFLECFVAFYKVYGPRN